MKLIATQQNCGNLIVPCGFYIFLDSVSSADNLYKQLGSRSGPTFCWALSGSNLFDTWIDSRRQKSGKTFQLILTFIPPIFFLEKDVCFVTSAAYIQVHFRLDFIMEANTLNPVQTAPRSSLICVHFICNIGYLKSLCRLECRRQKLWLLRKS